MANADVNYFYQKALLTAPPGPIVQLNASQIDIIKREARQSFSHAFKFQAVAILRVPPYHARNGNGVEVSGASSPYLGFTDLNKSISAVYYQSNLVQAQYALSLAETDLSTATSSPSFTNLLRAVGRGIGNNAACSATIRSPG